MVFNVTFYKIANCKLLNSSVHNIIKWDGNKHKCGVASDGLM